MCPTSIYWIDFWIYTEILKPWVRGRYWLGMLYFLKCHNEIITLHFMNGVITKHFLNHFWPPYTDNIILSFKVYQVDTWKYLKRQCIIMYYIVIIRLNDLSKTCFLKGHWFWNNYWFSSSISSIYQQLAVFHRVGSTR